MLDGLTKETSIAAFLFGKRVIELGGLLFVALYCKQCASSLQIAYGGVVPQRGLLPVPVSLTRSGYPRIIPAFHRQMIRRHDSKADQLVRVYLSFFSISKIIRLAKRVSDSTFCSIVEPWTNTDLVLQTVSGVKLDLPALLRRYIPFAASIPLSQGMRWVPSWKALPNSGMIRPTPLMKTRWARRN